MILYCVRHGESTYNSLGRIQGQADVPLSDLGLRQSEALAAALAEFPIEALYASPLRRAMQTAEPVAGALNLEVRTDRRLAEIHAGVFQDKLRSELPDLYPEQVARWRSGDPDFAIPGGESRRDLMRRGREVFEAIRRSGHRHVAVVSHGGLLSAAIKDLLEIPAGRHPFKLHNGSISQLYLGDGQMKLLSLNDVSHLREVGFTGLSDL